MEAALDNQDSFSVIDLHFFEQIVARSSEGILLLDAADANLPIAYVNSAFESLTGYRARDVIGKPWHVLERERGEHHGVDELLSAVERAEPIEVELPDRRKDGTIWICQIAFSKLADARGTTRYYLIQQRPSPRRLGFGVREAVPASDAIRARTDVTGFAGRTDPITGLPRFEHFEAVLNRDIAIARRDRRPVTLMLFEILELDAYRATFGAKAAESCVRMIGGQIGGTLRRAGDLCARHGDTTIVAAVLGQDEAEAGRLAERIVANVHRLKLHNPRAKYGRYVAIESALVGGVPGPDDNVEAWLDRARRLLDAKLAEKAARYAAGPESEAVLAGGS
ncbi:MAG: diguanylate cyclase [Gammaproteobacteria bacterium]|nr:hypothetical protein [Gammaproteobacteria bacterium]